MQSNALAQFVNWKIFPQAINEFGMRQDPKVIAELCTIKSSRKLRARFHDCRLRSVDGASNVINFEQTRTNAEGGAES
jgi:hypothetical protein